jgi:Ran GTPase-activating protein (RanGAP) involved in mRNA processing and transport
VPVSASDTLAAVREDLIGDHLFAEDLEKLSPRSRIKHLDDTSICPQCAERSRVALAWGVSELEQGEADLDLACRKLEDPGILVLAKVLATSSAICTVSLWGNRVGDAGAVAIAGALLGGCPKLTKLALGSNRIEKDGAVALASLVVGRLVVSLDLSNNRLGKKGAAAIGAALKESDCTLVELDLAGNNMCDYGAWEIGEALEMNTVLRTLELKGNCIEAKGIGAICRGLQKNASLKRLGIGCNSIGERGALKLADAIVENQSLNVLELQGADLGGEKGASALAKALRSNTGLARLDISKTVISENGQLAFAEALKVNKTLTSIGGVGKEFEAAFTKSLCAR